MITNTSNIFEFKTKETGYIAKACAAPEAGEKREIYIPRLMPNIKSGTPKTSTLSSRGNLVFKNAPACKVQAATVLKSQNYIMVPYEKNKTWDDPEIKSMTQITCNCKNNTIAGITFSND
jgi:hypothetical protein